MKSNITVSLTYKINSTTTFVGIVFPIFYLSANKLLLVEHCPLLTFDYLFILMPGGGLWWLLVLMIWTLWKAPSHMR